jgi:hypothetical protein
LAKAAPHAPLLLLFSETHAGAIRFVVLQRKFAG